MTVFLLVILGIILVALSLLIGFFIGFSIGYDTYTHDKTNNAHVERGKTDSMEQDSTSSDSFSSISL